MVRRLAAQPVVAEVLRKIGYALLPPSTMRPLTVQSGIGEGLTLLLNPRWQQRMWQGTYEPSVQRAVAPFFAPGHVVYDVGGGIGFYSLAAASRGAEVFMFEPDPKNIAGIERHAQMNGLSDAFTLVPMAAFSRTGTLQMEPSKLGHGPGHAIATEIWDSGSGDRFEARCTTLDDFARNHPQPHLIKVDAEGSEAEVIKGAERLMREAGPALLCEVHDVELTEEVERVIRSRNYQLTRLRDPEYHVSWIYATPSQSPCAA
jgi:FkbM family methyltransferase